MYYLRYCITRQTLGLKFYARACMLSMFILFIHLFGVQSCGNPQNFQLSHIIRMKPRTFIYKLKRYGSLEMYMLKPGSHLL